MELLSSYAGLSFMSLCILFMYVLMACKLMFLVSYMTKYVIYISRFDT